MNLTQENIKNLTSLWIEASKPFKGFIEKKSFSYSYISDAEWPNKLWLQPATQLTNLDLIETTMNNTPVELVFSYFDENMEVMPDILRQKFVEKYIQYGMVLSFSEAPGKIPEIQLKRVSNQADAIIWCQAFQQAFGYKISVSTLEKSWNNIPFHLIYHKQEIVGTVIMYPTNRSMGIHALGIIPAQRRKGFAKLAMHSIIELSFHQEGIQQITLQASKMAKPMYEELGFSTQFIMRNFKLKNQL